MRARRATLALLLALLLPLGPSARAATEGVRLTFHHVTISVADVDGLSRWYVDKLGFRLAKRFAVADGAVQIAWLDLGQVRLGLVQAAGSARAEPQNALPPKDVAFQGYKHLVYAVDDVDKAYARLLAAGVAGVLAPASSTPPAIRIAYLRDPEGNVFGLYQDLDPANAIAP